MTIHMQKGEGFIRRFCASVAIGGRVRAVVGTTAPLNRSEQRQWLRRYKEKARHGETTALSRRAVAPEWRIETLTVIWAG